MKEIKYSVSPNFGSDPEFFFTMNGQVVGSEKIIPPAGISVGPTTTGGSSKFVIDGVQAELNPSPNTCRANFGNEISKCFRVLYDRLKKEGKDIEVAFKPLVDISQDEMNSLSEKAKVFGCAPSQNAYTKEESKIKVDPTKYLRRSAGGHIHIGTNGQAHITSLLKNAEVMVPLLDLIVGNTCVLIDRDEANIERRKVYGRCGEYRIKDYGLEYRTLSNFWLRSYQLMSFVLGITRFAVNVAANSKPNTDTNDDYIKEFISKVKPYRVKRAINRNDFDLAMENFLKIKPLIEEATLFCKSPGNEHVFSLSCANINEFLYFVEKVKEHGLEYWFKESPLEHWMKLPDGHHCGWETFTLQTLRPHMKAAKRLEEKLVTKKFCYNCYLEVERCGNPNHKEYNPTERRVSEITYLDAVSASKAV